MTPPREVKRYDHIGFEDEMGRWVRWVDHAALVSQLRARVDSQQARIDALMMEYCPDEMTEEQLAEWGKRQIAVAKEDAERIKMSLGDNQ